jgi:hypothetical protein
VTGVGHTDLTGVLFWSGASQRGQRLHAQVKSP